MLDIPTIKLLHVHEHATGLRANNTRVMREYKSVPYYS